MKVKNNCFLLEDLKGICELNNPSQDSVVWYVICVVGAFMHMCDWGWWNKGHKKHIWKKRNFD